MSDMDYEALKNQFDDFSLRLDARSGEFRQNGMFATTHAAYAEKLLQGRASVEARLEAAVHSGDGWEAARAELERDIAALVGDLGHLEEALDAQSMKHSPESVVARGA